MHWDDAEPVANTEEGPLAGKTFVITGTLPTMTRDEAKQKLQSLGARVTTGVSKKTTYVVVGRDAGSKAAKAVQLRVETLGEEEFLDLIASVSKTGR